MFEFYLQPFTVITKIQDRHLYHPRGGFQRRIRSDEQRDRLYQNDVVPASMLSHMPFRGLVGADTTQKEPKDGRLLPNGPCVFSQSHDGHPFDLRKWREAPIPYHYHTPSLSSSWGSFLRDLSCSNSDVHPSCLESRVIHWWIRRLLGIHSI